MLNESQLKSPWVMYAKCRVLYTGRANSVLPRGNYLVIHKADDSLLIHAGCQIPPRNYLGQGTTFNITDDGLIAFRKREELKIELTEVLFFRSLDAWSLDTIKITKTEKELVRKLENAPEYYFGFTPDQVIREHQTAYGPVDLILLQNDTWHIIEVKRAKITVAACLQIKKYASDINHSSRLYVAAPEIAPKALEFCRQNAIAFVSVRHEQLEGEGPLEDGREFDGPARSG